jgi:C-terminal processing protease CtpA/Prc
VSYLQLWARAQKGTTSEFPRGTAQMPAMRVPLETLGIELVHSHETGNFRIARLWPHGPAAASGQLGEGDTLLCVQGVSVNGLPMHVVQSILDGNAEHSGRGILARHSGSVTVIAQRAGGGGVFVVSLTRRALDPEDGAAAAASAGAGGQADGGQRTDDLDSASTDSLYLLDGPMESQ